MSADMSKATARAAADQLVDALLGHSPMQQVEIARLALETFAASERAELLAALREIADNRPFDDPIEHANFAMERARKALESVAKKPCGECHLQPGEICDICGARAALAKAEERR